MKKLEKLEEFRLDNSSKELSKMQTITGGRTSGGWDNGTCTSGGDCMYVNWNEAGEPIGHRYTYQAC